MFRKADKNTMCKAMYINYRLAQPRALIRMAQYINCNDWYSKPVQRFNSMSKCRLDAGVTLVTAPSILVDMLTAHATNGDVSLWMYYSDELDDYYFAVGTPSHLPPVVPVQAFEDLELAYQCFTEQANNLQNA